MARVPSVSPEEVDEKYRDLLTSKLQDGKPLNLYAALGNNPEVLAGLRSYLSSLWADSGLPERERELLILTVADEADADYEWHQHLLIADDVGLSDAEITAVVTGDPGALSDREALVVAYARSVVEGEVSDDLHDRMVAAFDHATVVGAANIAGAYLGLARVIDALGVEVEED